MIESTDGIIEILRQILIADLDLNLEPTRVTPEVPLFEGGLDLDSIVIIELIGAIEERFGIEFDESDLRMSSFENLSVLGDLIGRRLREAG